MSRITNCIIEQAHCNNNNSFSVRLEIYGVTRSQLYDVLQFMDDFDNEQEAAKPVKETDRVAQEPETAPETHAAEPVSEKMPVKQEASAKPPARAREVTGKKLCKSTASLPESDKLDAIDYGQLRALFDIRARQIEKRVSYQAIHRITTPAGVSGGAFFRAISEIPGYKGEVEERIGYTFEIAHDRKDKSLLITGKIEDQDEDA